MRIRGICILLAGGVALAPSFASGGQDPTQKKYRVVYDVPAGCPGKSEFVRHVTERAGTHWQSGSEQATGTLVIEVSSARGRFEGNVVCISSKGTISRRNFEQLECEETILDMAVASVACIQSDTDPPPLALDVGATAGVNWSVGAAAFGAGALFGIRWPGSQFSLAIAPEYSDTGTIRANGSPAARLRFRIPAVRVDACLLEPRFSDALSLPLCAQVGFGYLFARFEDPATDWKETPWATLGFAPRIRISSSRTFVELGPAFGVYLGKRKLEGRSAEEGLPAETSRRHDIPIMSLGVSLRAGFTF